MKSRHHGFSLIEIAVALAILGIISAGLLVLWQATHTRHAVLSERDLLERAEQALVAFSRNNSRLPCPAADSSGTESCPSSKGFLPWQTLGLPDQMARQIRYGVFVAGSTTTDQDADLTKSIDRFKPLLTTKASDAQAPVAMETSLGNANGVDFCHALRYAGVSTATPKTSALYVTGTQNLNVAFALALPGTKDADGDGNLFDGSNVTAAPVFESPQRVADTTYDDQVRTKSFSTLFGDLSCGEILASADHAHFNIASAATMMFHGMLDHYTNLQLAKELADAGAAAAAAALLTASADLAAAIADEELAVAESLNTASTAQGVAGIPLAAAAIVAASIGVASATAELALALAAVVEAQLRLDEFDGKYKLMTNSRFLATDITNNARNADLAGIGP